MPNTGSMAEYRGTVVQDKKNDSTKILAYSDDLLPFVTGSITATQMSSNVRSVNSAGERSNVSVKSQNYITAEWRDDTAGHSGYPPDVRAGEQVILYNYGDSDQWYWRSANRNNNARRSETWCLMINDTMSNAADLSDDNCYVIRVDTRRGKEILLQTSKSDGEAFRYKFSVNAETNHITLGDDDGNFIDLDSNVPAITLRNKADSIIKLDNQDIIITCKGKLIVNALKDISVSTNATYTLSANSDITVSTPTNYKLSSNVLRLGFGGGASIGGDAGGVLTLTVAGMNANSL